MGVKGPCRTRRTYGPDRSWGSYGRPWRRYFIRVVGDELEESSMEVRTSPGVHVVASLLCVSLGTKGDSKHRKGAPRPSGFPVPRIVADVHR